MELQKIKHIRDWKELSKEESPTHVLNIDLRYGSGWIHPKNADDNSLDSHHYLSTHTFYGTEFKHSTEILQSCGFNVELDNWDKKEEKMCQV